MKLVRGLLTCVLTLAVGGYGYDPLRGHSDITFDVSPAGDQIVFAASGDGLRDLYLLQLAAHQVTRIAQTPEYEQDPAFSPDGKSILYGASVKLGGSSHIFVRSLDAKPPKQLTQGEFYDAMPSSSPDGSRIVFARAHRHRPYSMGGWTWDNWDAYVMNADGTNLKRITQKNYYQLSRPQLSADGATVVFSAVQTGVATNILEVPVSGNRAPRPLTTDGHSSDPGLAPDDQRIVFISDRAKAYDYDLYLMDSDGANLRRVTHNKAQNAHPVPTSDGKRIFFLSDAGGNPFPRYSLWEVGRDGTNLTQIADPHLFDAPLKWRPRH